MLKFDVKDNKINFDDLEVGATFLIKSQGYEWYGMKISETCEWEENKCYILDLSDTVGTLYSDVDMYNIVDIVDLKVVRDEGEV